MNNECKYLMNPHTGSVDTEENWIADFYDQDYVEDIDEWMQDLIEVTSTGEIL